MPRIVPLSTSILMLAALAACQPQDPEGKPAAPPADAPAATVAVTPVSSSGMDISRPISLRGTEPFWAAEILDGTKIRFMRPDHPDLNAVASGAAISPGGATWIAKSPDGEQLTVNLKTGECSDGMSDLKYPMTAEVVLMNETLKGCAAKTADLPTEGG